MWMKSIHPGDRARISLELHGAKSLDTEIAAESIPLLDVGGDFFDYLSIF